MDRSAFSSLCVLLYCCASALAYTYEDCGKYTHFTANLPEIFPRDIDCRFFFAKGNSPRQLFPFLPFFGRNYISPEKRLLRFICVVFLMLMSTRYLFGDIEQDYSIQGTHKVKMFARLQFKRVLLYKYSYTVRLSRATLSSATFAGSSSRSVRSNFNVPFQIARSLLVVCFPSSVSRTMRTFPQQSLLLICMYDIYIGITTRFI